VGGNVLWALKKFAKPLTRKPLGFSAQTAGWKSFAADRSHQEELLAHLQAIGPPRRGSFGRRMPDRGEAHRTDQHALRAACLFGDDPLKPLRKELGVGDN